MRWGLLEIIGGVKSLGFLTSEIKIGMLHVHKKLLSLFGP
jgi:hypothetical protein